MALTTNRDQSEKRNFIRMKIDTMVTFVPENGGERHQARCRNLSGNGMLLETDKKVSVGDRLYVNIPSENSEFSNLSALVEILRVKPFPDQHKYELGAVIQKIHS